MLKHIQLADCIDSPRHRLRKAKSSDVASSTLSDFFGILHTILSGVPDYSEL